MLALISSSPLSSINVEASMSSHLLELIVSLDLFVCLQWAYFHKQIRSNILTKAIIKFRNVYS